MEKSKNYTDLVTRNRGFLTENQQDRLAGACVAVCGVGGLGGIVAEILARSGVGHIRILDLDTFDSSNRNRQIFAFTSTMGKRKIDVTEAFLKDINPEITMEKFDHIDRGNMDRILAGCDVIVNALDGIRGYIRISRRAREMHIPLVESWALPYANVRVIDTTTPDLEQIYDLPTRGKNLDDFSDTDLEKMHIEVLMTFTRIRGITRYYRKKTLWGRLDPGSAAPSFAPMVWGSGVAMATETIKVITGMGKISRAPGCALYDPWLHRIPGQLAKRPQMVRLWKQLVRGYIRFRQKH